MIDESIRDAITAHLGRIAAAWEAGDADQLARAFAEDAVFVAFDGSRLLGRAAIFRFHRHPFATVLRGTRLFIDLVEIRALPGGACLVATRGGPGKARDSAVPETQSYIFRDLGDRWEIAFFQNTPVLRAR